MDIYINLDLLRIKEVDNCSGIFSGENRHSSWTSTSKSNQGLGSVSGDENIVSNGINLVEGRPLK